MNLRPESYFVKILVEACSEIMITRESLLERLSYPWNYSTKFTTHKKRRFVGKINPKNLWMVVNSRLEVYFVKMPIELSSTLQRFFGLMFPTKQGLCSKTAQYQPFWAIFRCCVTTTRSVEKFQLANFLLNFWLV